MSEKRTVRIEAKLLRRVVDVADALEALPDRRGAFGGYEVDGVTFTFATTFGGEPSPEVRVFRDQDDAYWVEVTG